jgi:divinyl chlorophyllide a 8-vinyl-reductase
LKIYAIDDQGWQKRRMVKSGNNPAKRIMLLGATGTVGRATLQVLVQNGYDVTCFVRPKAGDGTLQPKVQGAEWRVGDITNPTSLRNDGFRGEAFDAVISCLASRTGAPDDAWAIDYQAHVNVLVSAQEAGVQHMVLLSAICVQKPKLQFQHAKLAFEKMLIESGLTFSIVRPTALFKSLSGQIERLKKGKAFLVFGHGELTACKPISDNDLAHFIVRCIEDKTLHNSILPIGGPGSAITPKQQGAMLFTLLKRTPRYSHVPIALLDTIIWSLSKVGALIPACARKAELARIGRYYATESMLVFNQPTQHYDAAATPATGADTLFDYYADLIQGKRQHERGEHSVF